MSSVPKKKVITTSVTCTKVPRPLRNLKLSKKKFSSGNLLEAKKSQNSQNNSSSLLTTSARSLSLSGFSFSSTSDQSKVIPPDEYYCESPPSGFGSSESSSRPLTGTPSAREPGTSASATRSSSSAKDSALSITSITASSSPVGTNTPISSGSTNCTDHNDKRLLASSGQLEDDSGQGDFEEELQFSLVSSSSNFDLISNSEETESGSYSYSYTCSNSCCTTGCFSDEEEDEEDEDERDGSHSRSSSCSQTHSPRTISELNDSELGPSDDDEAEVIKERREEEDRGDSELEKDREASDKTFELYLKRVEKLKRVLSHWDTFLNENGISRPDFFCRYKERESLQQIIEDFQKITSRHREGLLSALKEDHHRGNEGLSGLVVDIEDTTSGSSDAKVRRNGWRNKRVRKLLMAGELIGDASSSNEAAHLQQKLKNLSSELVTLRNRLHVNGQPSGSNGGTPNSVGPPGFDGQTPPSTAPPEDDHPHNTHNGPSSTPSGPQIPPHNPLNNFNPSLPRNNSYHQIHSSYPNKPLPPHPPLSPPSILHGGGGGPHHQTPMANGGSGLNNNGNNNTLNMNNNNNNSTGYYVNQNFQKDVLRINGGSGGGGGGGSSGLDIGVSNCSSTSSPTDHINTPTTTSKLGVHVVHGISGLSNSSSTNTTNGTSGISSSGNLIHSTTGSSSNRGVLSSSPFGNIAHHLSGHGHSIKSTNSTRSSNSVHERGGVVGGIVIPNEVSGGGCGSTGSVIGTVTTTTTSGGSNGDATPSESSFKCSNRSVPLLGRRAVSRRKVNLSEIEDLIHLDGPLTEDAVIRCLQARSSSGKYSVYMGPIPLMTNRLTALGNPLTLASTRDIHAPQPVRKVVQEALRQQAETSCPQAIILSGVSGSGKTYTSLLVLRQLFEMAGGGVESDAFKHLAASITVLRSLGTARTSLNRDSSRVGHFIEVQVTDGTVYRTKVHCYFLDQTRVVKTAVLEKNYHIFYQMLAGLSDEERDKLHLGKHTVSSLKYLSSGDVHSEESEDARRFLEWKASLGMLGIPFLDVVRVLAAVILIGNVEFKESSCMEMEVEGETELQSAAALLGVSETALKQGLTMRTHNVHRNQLVRSRCDANLSNFTRDSLAKSLYCRTVATIVRRANSLKRLGSTSGTMSSDSTDSVNNQAEVASQHASTVGTAGSKASKSMTALNNAVRHATDGFIGVLDMFGFEDVRPSHLEHLCINLCAETMQHFYNTHIFKASFDSCRVEGIQCDWEVDYVDNVPCIDLISSLRTGLLSMLDVECSGRGTIESYVQKLRSQHIQNPRLLDTNPTEQRSFAIQHYAGRVLYDATDFLDTNRDILADDLVAVFHKHRCSFGFASHLFSSELKVLGAGGMEPSPRGISFRISPTSHTELLNGDEPVSTLTQDFHTRLDNLLRTLVHAKPHFIRCIKINQNEQPDLFDRHVVSKQLRAFQVLETVNLMAYGYAHRMRFKAFNTRYKLLAPFQQLSRTDDRATEDCQLILECFEHSVGGSCTRDRLGHISISWALGKKHIFLSEGARQQLETLRTSTRSRAATLIQSTWRGWNCRQRYPIFRQGLQFTTKHLPPNHIPPPNNPMSASAFITSGGPGNLPRHPPNLFGGPPPPPPTSNGSFGPPHLQKPPSSSLSPLSPSLLPNTPSCPQFPPNSHSSFNGRNANGGQQPPLPPLPPTGPPPQPNGMGHPLIGANSTSLNPVGVPVPAPRGVNPPPPTSSSSSSITNTALPSIPPGCPPHKSSTTTTTNLLPPQAQVIPPNAPNSVCSSSNSNNSGSGGRPPRPQPIAGTPPPETNEKCDAKLVQQTCSLFGLDMERPPPLPPSRSYTVAGNTKLGYPQTRVMKMTYPDENTSSEARLLKGDSVTVIGTSGRRGHLMVEHKSGRTIHVPFQYLELKSPPPE